jgi:hypothetical protein
MIISDGRSGCVIDRSKVITPSPCNSRKSDAPQLNIPTTTSRTSPDQLSPPSPYGKQSVETEASISPKLLFFMGGAATSLLLSINYGVFPALIALMVTIGAQALLERYKKNKELGPASSWVGWTLKSFQ